MRPRQQNLFSKTGVFTSIFQLKNDTLSISINEIQKIVKEALGQTQKKIIEDVNRVDEDTKELLLKFAALQDVLSRSEAKLDVLQTRVSEQEENIADIGRRVGDVETLVSGQVAEKNKTEKSYGDLKKGKY